MDVAGSVSVRRKVPVVLSEYQREQLIRWVSTPGTPSRIVRRSRIILQLASGQSVHRSALALGISEPTIRLWRDRFRTGGIDALTTDAPRPGRPRRARDHARALVSERLAELPPGLPPSVRALSRDTGLGRHMVHQVLQDLSAAGTSPPPAPPPARKSLPDQAASTRSTTTRPRLHYTGLLRGMDGGPPGPRFGGGMRHTAVAVALGLGIAIGAAGATLARGAADDVMGSRAVDWKDMTARKTKVGEVRQVFQDRTATLDELELHVTTLLPGQTTHAPHKHPDEEVLVVQTGTVETFLGDRTQVVGPGSVIFQAANQLHGIRNVGDVPATYHVIKWNSPGMKPRK